MTQENLLPCPKCDGQAMIYDADRNDWHIGCLKCGIKLEVLPFPIEEAIKEWNTRTSPTPAVDQTNCPMCGSKDCKDLLKCPMATVYRLPAVDQNDEKLIKHMTATMEQYGMVKFTDQYPAMEILQLVKDAGYRLSVDQTKRVTESSQDIIDLVKLIDKCMPLGAKEIAVQVIAAGWHKTENIEEQIDKSVQGNHELEDL